jgi:peptidyl-prolyl cis-trans isomerase A (cyclophilin A)
MAESNSNTRVQIAIAVLGLAGVLGGAIIGNWDKIFGSNANKPVSATTSAPSAPSGTSSNIDASSVPRSTAGAKDHSIPVDSVSSGSTGGDSVSQPSTQGKRLVPGKTIAVIDTTAGTLRCTLFEKETPETVANFIGLANGTKDWKDPVSGSTKHGVPLYDGTIFHRVIPNFMIQGGDPAGNGSGDPGYKFKDEIVPTLLFDQPGRLAMANSGPATNGSQFFITEVPTPHLNGRHTIFGQCDDASVELVKQMARIARDPSSDRPFRPLKIKHISIVGGAT